MRDLRSFDEMIKPHIDVVILCCLIIDNNSVILLSLRHELLQIKIVLYSSGCIYDAIVVVVAVYSFEINVILIVCHEY